jgi:hypothetical protein
MVLIQNDERNRGKWNVGIVVKLIKGKDGVVRAAKLRAGKSYLERAIQQLAPMELTCDDPPVAPEAEQATLNVEAREFRPRREAAAVAEERIRSIAEEDEIEH